MIKLSLMLLYTSKVDVFDTFAASRSDKQSDNEERRTGNLHFSWRERDQINLDQTFRRMGKSEHLEIVEI